MESEQFTYYLLMGAVSKVLRIAISAGELVLRTYIKENKCRLSLSSAANIIHCQIEDQRTGVGMMNCQIAERIGLAAKSYTL